MTVFPFGTGYQFYPGKTTKSTSVDAKYLSVDYDDEDKTDKEVPPNITFPFTKSSYNMKGRVLEKVVQVLELQPEIERCVRKNANHDSRKVTVSSRNTIDVPLCVISLFPYTAGGSPS